MRVTHNTMTESLVRYLTAQNEALYDRQTIIEGRLAPLPKNPNAAWADPVVLHDGPRKVASGRALHVKRSDGRREVHLTLWQFGGRDEEV